MSSRRARALRASSVKVVAVALGAASVALAGCGTAGRAGTPSPTVTTAVAAQGPKSLPPASIPPGGCPQLTGAVATLTVNDSGLDPRCATVTTAQQLKIVNNGKKFHNVQIIDLNANLEPGDTQFFEEVGKYFDPGNYLIYSWTDASLADGFHGTLVVKQG